MQNLGNPFCIFHSEVDGSYLLDDFVWAFIPFNTQLRILPEVTLNQDLPNLEVCLMCPLIVLHFVVVGGLSLVQLCILLNKCPILLFPEICYPYTVIYGKIRVSPEQTFKGAKGGGGVPMANYGELWRIAQLCWARFAIKTFAIIRHNSP